MRTGGAFLTSREIFENPIWQNIVEFRLFFLIYGNAIFSEEGVRIGDVQLKRGQWVRSIRNLQKDLEYIENRAVKSYSTSTIKRAIDSLTKQKRVSVEVSELGTLFTVVNYQLYQGFSSYSKENLEQPENSDETATKQRPNNNKNVMKENNEKHISPDGVPFSEIISFLNEHSGKSYKNATTHQKHIRARWNEGNQLEDFKRVIEHKCKEWKDTEWDKYLRPETLFGNKFDRYLNEVPKEQPVQKPRYTDLSIYD